MNIADGQSKKESIAKNDCLEERKLNIVSGKKRCSTRSSGTTPPFAKIIYVREMYYTKLISNSAHIPNAL